MIKKNKNDGVDGLLHKLRYKDDTINLRTFNTKKSIKCSYIKIFVSILFFGKNY